MAHLATMKKGWQNEHLGLFILSRMAFVASPVTVSDDLGSDFFCNLFVIEKRGEQEVLLPRHAFAIQLKSSPDIFCVSGKSDYLRSLEVAFFVGVVDQVNPSITVYSGEFMPMFFAKVGMPTRMRIRVVDGEVTSANDGYFERYRKNCYRLRCPKVVRIPARASPRTLRSAVKRIEARCSLMQANVQALGTSEHVYRVRDDAEFRILAGPGSAEVFRENLYLRLAEVFANFFWLATKQPDAIREVEWRTYERLRADLQSAGETMPTYVERAYAKARPVVDALFLDGSS